MFYNYWKRYLTAREIPSNANDLSIKNRFKNCFRFFKRFILLTFSGQLFLWKKEVGTKDKKLLFLFSSNNSLGDMLMDLAPRTLLKNSFEIDLFIQSGNRILFEEDPFFKNIFSDITEIDKNRYDLIVLDQLSSKVIRAKKKYLKNIPFVSTQGFFYGYQFNRTLFHFFRFNEIFKLNLSKEYILNNAKSSLFYEFSKIESTSENYIVLAIGGKDPNRTFSKWEKIVSELVKLEKLVLVGSSNGEKESSYLVEKFGVESYVGKTSLKETASIIKSSKIVVSADGGLLHIALSLGIPTVGIFVKPFKPEFRFTKNSNSKFVYEENIENVKEEDVISETKKLHQEIYSNHQ
jgi:ADP-heptose:LPS heptosyltransferase